MTVMDELIILENKDITSIGIYRPFKLLQGETATTNFTRLLDTIQKYIDQNKKRRIIISGDFNIDYLRMGDTSYQRHRLAELLLDFQIRNNLTQIVKEITRHRLVNQNDTQTLQTSLLDHVYTNFIGVEDCQILPSIVSDHDVILVTVESTNKTPSTEITYIRDWRHYSKAKLHSFLSKEDWDTINQTEDKTTLNDRLEQAIKKATDLSAPWTTIKSRGDTFIKDLNIRDLQKRRDRAYNVWKKNKTIINYTRLKALNQSIRNGLKNVKHKSIKSNLAKNNPKLFWRAVNIELGNKTQQKLSFKHGEILITNPEKTSTDL